MFMQHLQLLCSGKGRNSDPKKPRPDATMVTISSEAENDFVFSKNLRYRSVFEVGTKGRQEELFCIIWGGMNFHNFIGSVWL